MGSYDLVVNMHGLYGVPKEILPKALQRMQEALKADGTMVLAIGKKDSPYQEIPSLLGVPSVDSDDILDALRELGLAATTVDLTYDEVYDEHDDEGLQRFLMDECGGNIFPVDQVDAMDLEASSAAVKAYADAHFDAASRKYCFKQNIGVILLKRDANIASEVLN